MRPRARADLLTLGVLVAIAFLIRLIPHVRSGGLWGVIGYDDGVYFASAVAMTEGVLPYRDFLLVHPPGEPVVLLPFAVLGAWVGDGTALTIARIATMLAGAVSCVLAALVCGRSSRLAGLLAGLVYATWRAAAVGDRSTDLHAPQTVLLLAALLVLGRPGRVRPRRALLAGILLGLATSVQLWQGLAVVVLLWWVAVRGPRAGRRLADGRRSVAAYLVGAAGAFAAICAPFLLVAPWNAVRYTLVDQIGRPDAGIGLVDRLTAILAMPAADQLPVAIRFLAPAPWMLGPVALLTVLFILVTGYRHPVARPWTVLALAQTLVVLVTPSFFGDYATFPAPAASLVIGIGAASLLAPLVRRGWSASLTRRVSYAIVIPVIGLAVLVEAAFSLTAPAGSRVATGELTATLGDARCVSSDTPTLLVLTGTLRSGLRSGCPIVLDPSGVRYDTDRGHLESGSAGTRDAPGYQAAMQDWYGSSDAAMFTRSRLGFSADTWRRIEASLPLERMVGRVLVRLAEH